MKHLKKFNELSLKKESLKSLKELLINDERLSYLTFKINHLYIDFSKNPIDKEVISLFVESANNLGIKQKIDDMFSGKKINFTEHRAVLHTALRNNNLKTLILDNIDYAPAIKETKKRVFNFATKIINNDLKGITGKKFKHIVNIGIGGSYLGSKLLVNALSNFGNKDIDVHFISNIDYTNTEDVLKKINLEETLFIIASKTFTTLETISNANSIKDIVIKNLGIKSIEKHFVALSTNIKEATKFGILEENIFPFWDFIGGRYSIYSSIALPVIIKIGPEKFNDFLDGANFIDNHLQSSPLNTNIPFLMAITEIWNNNFLNYNANAIIPYSYNLRDFASFLQQLEMESNGKNVNINGEFINYKTSPIIFGEAGTDSQHSFFQALHQGTNTIPCSFIGFKKNSNTFHNNNLIANMIAQGEALAFGKDENEVINENPNINKNIINHKTFLGNKPSTTLLFNELNPYNLGVLIALYEHKVLIQGLFWEINSFDQWGVELGKVLAKDVVKDIEKGSLNKKFSLSTQHLIKEFQNNEN